VVNRSQFEDSKYMSVQQEIEMTNVKLTPKMEDKPEVIIDKDNTNVPISETVVSNENDPGLGECCITQILKIYVDNESVNPDKYIEHIDHEGVILNLTKDQWVILQLMI